MAIAILRTRLSLGIILAILLVCMPAVSLSFAADEKDAKVQTFRQMGKQLLDVGYEQYRRGMMDNAKETLGKAAAYREYLSVSDASKLDSLLEKLRSVPARDANQVPEQNIEQPVPAQKAKPVIVERPVAEANQLPVITPQTEIRPESVTPAAPAPQKVDTGVNVQTLPQQTQQEIPSEEKIKENYIEVVKQRQRIQQSYTKAVVNEALAKAKEYSDKEDFIKAKDEISRALGVIEKNKLLLGDADYSQYKSSLQQLLDQVNTRQTEVNRVKAETAQTEARTTQEKLRTQQATDRQKRIQDLLASSAEFQEQQRYEEALAQLETLLAIDPLNKTALRNKQMLEDIINLRRQIETKKEIGKGEEDVLYDTQKSMIPHASLFSLPRNWQDIAARKAKIISGLAPADAAVYKQLESIVDLSALTPDTPFSEAIETIRTSVEPPLKIFVLWKDLEENAYIEPDTVIGMQGLGGIMLRKGLEDLLRSVSGGVATVRFVVKDGVITVATTASLPPTLVTHVYDITELIGAPANYRIQLGTTTGGVTQTAVTDTAAVVEARAAAIMQMIQETIEPLSWLATGGEGTISLHGNGGIGNYRLVISQTPQIHEQIQKLLMEDLRESLGQQVSIETRFLFVTENFLEDIGLGISRITVPPGKINSNIGGMIFDMGSYESALPQGTLVPGSLGGGATTSYATELLGGVQIGSVLDDLTVSFFLKATQVHRDAKMVTAPRITVLSGEAAYIRVTKDVAYVSSYSFEDITLAGESQPSRVLATPSTQTTTGGVVLNVVPTITADKKYVILQINTSYTRATLTDFQMPATTGQEFTIQLPTLEVSEVQTRVSVPDSGTLLIGGQKIGAENNAEAGVPGVSKVPLIGRLFSHRSKVEDQDILLVLVKPTIILQEEKEREFFAPLE
ncbi:MAG: hypothetical protein ABSE89_10455 [Sedimentisphaerales bacterium]